MNLSQEGYDSRLFFQIIYSDNWRGQCCEQVCESLVSQADADLCAQNKALVANLGDCSPVVHPDGTVACVDNQDDGCPTCDPPLPPIYWNTEQCWSASCPGGAVFYSCVPAHTYSATSQAEADAIALSVARNQVPLVRFCIDPTVILCCQNTATAKVLDISGGTAAFSWTVLTGSIPTGLSLLPYSPDQRQMQLNGTPTVAGVSSFTVQVVDALGHVNHSTVTVGVIGFTPSVLPDATLGQAYSQQLTAVGVPTGMTAVFSITTGALPTGLTLSQSGLISGTPTGGLPATFTVGVTVS